MIIVRIALGLSHEATTAAYTSSTRRGTNASAPIRVKMSTFKTARNDLNETIEMTTSDTLASRAELEEKEGNSYIVQSDV